MLGFSLIQNELSPAASHKLIASLGSLVLWLVTAFLGLASILALREILLFVLAKLLIKPHAISNADAIHTIYVANDCGSLIFGILCLGVIVVTSDYVFKHVGQPRLIRLLAGLIAVECVLVLPVAFIFWRT
jgi:hypothetical protein